MTLYITDIRELVGHEQDILALLTPKRRERVERLRPAEDKLRSMAAGLLLRHVLGVTSDDDLRCGQFGKPELTAGSPCFNLSHGGNYVVLAVGETPLGADIEPIGEKLPIAIPKRWLLPEELSHLGNDPTPESFAWLWTRLESALKADGRGFLLEDRVFSVLEDGEWCFQTISFNGHIISCASERPFEMNINQLSVQELLT